jgi:hypothetical protein
MTWPSGRNAVHPDPATKREIHNEHVTRQDRTTTSTSLIEHLLSSSHCTGVTSPPVTAPIIARSLACGNLKNRREILELLQTLCTCPVATHEEALSFLEANHLMGRGLGYIDMHLLASAKLSGIPLWTLDRPLRTGASCLSVACGD